MSGLIYAVYAVWSIFLAVSGPTIAALIAAFVLAEMSLVSLRLAFATGKVVDDPAVRERVAPFLAGVCAAAGCAIPRVLVRTDNLRPAAVVVRKRTGPILMLSREYVERLTDSELQAIVSHEIVHIARGDLRAHRTRATAAAVVGAVVALSTLLVASDGVVDLPIWTAGFVVGVIAATSLLAPLNKWRELRADSEGAALADDGLAMIGALEKAYALTDEARARVFGRPPTSWLLAPISWRQPTHPSLAKRAAHLQPAPLG